MTGAFESSGSVFEIVGACSADPDRWMSATDDAAAEVAKTICRGCPRRWLCARDAVETPGAEGIWAGIVVPEAGRGRTFALKQLASLAHRGGYPVRKRRRLRPEDLGLAPDTDADR